MNLRAQDLCRRLRPLLGRRIDRLWAAYLAESDSHGRAEIEQALELLAAKHLGSSFQPDRSPFPPPTAEFAASGDIPLGAVSYADREMFPFSLRSGRLKEHVLISGRSGSGKTNLTFILLRGIMDRGIKVLALDWKRGYRDLKQLRPDLHIYTIGRDVSPFRFNPFIPPPGCEPYVWIKLIVDVIASAYLGGEGVISLLVAGLDHLYSEVGVPDGTPARWPTVADLLAWLRKAKLKGRAAMWQASAERILLAMTYGEFGAVLNTQDNGHLRHLLDHNVVLEMDGLSSSSDRVLFSEALTLHLYRYRLAQGPRPELTNMIVLEEAHNLLLAKQAGTRETILETSIRMIRQYGLGYVFVDQSASLLSKVAFANSYATIALSQKLRGDIQAMSGAMNLTEEQRDSLSTLPIGTAVVRLADDHPEPFMVKVPLCPIREGVISDDQVRSCLEPYSTDSEVPRAILIDSKAVSPIPTPDNNRQLIENDLISHPPTPEESKADVLPSADDSLPDPPKEMISREAIRFLTDVATRPLSTTVPRYLRLNLSRRRGNAIRKDLLETGLIDAVPIPTRSGQVVLCQLTGGGRSACTHLGIDPGPHRRESIEHLYWVTRVARYFEMDGYDVTREYHVDGNGDVDIVAERAGCRVAIEIETGKSDIKKNILKSHAAGFDRHVLVATSPAALTACQRAVDETRDDAHASVELMTWLDI